MARSRKTGITHHRKNRSHYLLALVQRDPLTSEFLNSPYYEPQTDEAWRCYWEYQSRFRQKWGVDVTPLPPQPSELLEGQIPDRVRHLKDKKQWDRYDLEAWRQWVFASGIKPKHVMISNPWWPIQWTVNRGCVGRTLSDSLYRSYRKGGIWHGTTTECVNRSHGHRAEGWDGCHRRSCFGAYGVSLDQAHTLNLEVDLASITTRNLEDIAVEIKEILRTVLPFAPNAPKQKSPKDLDFLRTITQKAFDRALKAYDLHIKEGLTFARTAQRLKREGVRISPDRVEQDVKQIYRAIYREGYKASRRRRDNPAVGQPDYNCPDHLPLSPGQLPSCPKTCKNLQAFAKRVYLTLPTDYTGA